MDFILVTKTNHWRIVQLAKWSAAPVRPLWDLFPLPNFNTALVSSHKQLVTVVDCNNTITSSSKHAFPKSPRVLCQYVWQQPLPFGLGISIWRHGEKTGGHRNSTILYRWGEGQVFHSGEKWFSNADLIRQTQWMPHHGTRVSGGSSN